MKFHGDTPEVTQGNWIYSLNGTVKDKTDPTAVNGTPDGDGSVDTPFNVAGALTYIKTLGSATSDNKYVKGIVTSITEVSVQNGNATYYISDDAAGTDKLLIYRAKNFDNKDYTAENEIAVGDEVIVCGKIINYNGNTPEFASKQNYLVSLNGNTATGIQDVRLSETKGAVYNLTGQRVGKPTQKGIYLINGKKVLVK